VNDPAELNDARCALLPELIAAFCEIVDSWDSVCGCGRGTHKDAPMPCRHVRARAIRKAWEMAEDVSCTPEA
jgi:hypothetical protein